MIVTLEKNAKIIAQLALDSAISVHAPHAAKNPAIAREMAEQLTRKGCVWIGGCLARRVVAFKESDWD